MVRENSDELKPEAVEVEEALDADETVSSRLDRTDHEDTIQVENIRPKYLVPYTLLVSEPQPYAAL